MNSTTASKARGYTTSGGIASALAALSAADSALSASIAAVLPSQTGNSGKYLTTNGTSASWGTVSSPSAANPSASIGLSAVNGSASTFMRSDGAPALDQAITPTMTGAWIFSKAGAASTPAVSLTGAPFAGTGTTSFPLFYLNRTGATASTTMNAAGTFIGINTSGSEDFFNGMVNGVSSFKVTSAGILTSTSGSNAAIDLTASACGIRIAGQTIRNSIGGGVGSGLYIAGICFHDNAYFGVSNGSGSYLRGISAGVLEIRSESLTTGQQLKINNTWTNTSNYERGTIGWSSNVLQIGTEKLGTGTARNMALVTDGTTRATVSSTAFTLSSGLELKLGNAATTGLTAGVLAATTNATVTITDSTGQVYRIPCII